MKEKTYVTEEGGRVFKKLYLLAILVTATLILVLGFLLFFEGPATTQIDGPIKLSINQNWPGYAYVFIAEEKGFFEKHGVEVELVKTQSPSESRDLYVEGVVDGMFTAYPFVVALWDEYGMSSEVVYTMDYSGKEDAIVGEAKIGTLSNYHGGRIGVDGIHSFSNMFVVALAEKFGISEYSLEFENVSGDDALKMLQDGKIVAAHLWGSQKREALDMGYVVLASAEDVPGVIVDVLAINPELTQRRAEDVQALIAAIVEAEEFMQSDYPEALEIMAHVGGDDVEELDATLRGINILNLHENVHIMSSSDEIFSLYDSGILIIDFLLSRGQIQDVPDLSEIINPSFINHLWSS